MPKANPTVWADFTATMIRRHELDWSGPLRGSAITPASVAWASDPTGLVFTKSTVLGDRTVIDISHPPVNSRRDFEIRCKMTDSDGFIHETEPPIQMRMYPGGSFSGLVLTIPVVVEVPLLTLTLTLFPPTVAIGVEETAPALTLTLTLFAPEVSIALGLAPPALTLTLTLFPPVVTLVAPIQPDEIADFDFCDMANGKSLQVWWDMNDLPTMFINEDDGVNGWTGSNPSMEGDDVGTMINKAYPVADFPDRGEIASPIATDGTMDLGYGNISRLGTLSAHNKNAGSEEFPATATWCWRGNDGGGGIAIIETRPSQLQAEFPGNHLTECLDPSPRGQTRIFAVEVPGGTDTQGYQKAFSSQLTTFQHDLYYAGNQTSLGNTAFNMFVRDFESGSHGIVSDLYVPPSGPHWDILSSVTNNTDNRVTWYRNGKRILTYISDNITDNKQMRFGSNTALGDRWENGIGEYCSYNRLLTDIEHNGLIKGFSVRHGARIEGTVGAGGVLLTAPLQTLSLTLFAPTVV